MGLFDLFTGGTRPDPAVPKLSKDALLARLLDVRDAPGVWQVRRAALDEGGADVAAEWVMSHDLRLAFGASGEQQSFQILMRLLEEETVVRSLDKEVVARWTADAGALSLSGLVTAFRGQKVMKGGTWTFGRKPDGDIGVLDERRWGHGRHQAPAVRHGDGRRLGLARRGLRQAMSGLTTVARVAAAALLLVAAPGCRSAAASRDRQAVLRPLATEIKVLMQQLGGGRISDGPTQVRCHMGSDIDPTVQWRLFARTPMRASSPASIAAALQARRAAGWVVDARGAGAEASYRLRKDGLYITLTHLRSGAGDIVVSGESECFVPSSR